MRIVWPSPRTLVRPRKMASVPSVVMSALMPTMVTKRRLITPMHRVARTAMMKALGREPGAGPAWSPGSPSCCGEQPRGRDRIAGQVGDDLALGHDVDPVGDLDGLFVIGRGDEDGHALRGEDAECLVDVLASADV